MKTLAQVLDSSGYSQQIQSEEWHAFTASFRTRHGNFCDCCRQSGKILQVHHWYYDRRKLTEYHDADLSLLCAECHQQLHAELMKFRRFVFKKMNPQSFRVINGALAVAFDQYNPLVFAHALAEFAANPRLVENHAGAWSRSETAQPS